MPPRRKRPEAEGDDFTWRLASAISTRRYELGLSQEQLAERAGLSTKYLGRIERGQVNASLDTLERVVSALAPRRKSRLSKTWATRTIAGIDDVQASLTSIKKWLQSTTLARP
jgi:predicted transcriptional regulator